LSAGGYVCGVYSGLLGIAVQCDIEDRLKVGARTWSSSRARLGGKQYPSGETGFAGCAVFSVTPVL
jgi:hypothetical protein